jgi:lysozyme family protein
MPDVFDAFAPALLQREGGGTFTDRAADKGGPTRWGIDAETLGRWRKLGRSATAAEVQALGETEALTIYRQQYFVLPGFQQVAAISPRLAEELLDTGVNMGPHWSSVWLQRSLNLCNRQGEDYADLVVDGGVGGKTVTAIQALLQRRGVRAGEDLLLKCLNGFQFERYVEITEAGGPNGAQEQNFVGWINQRIGLAAA